MWARRIDRLLDGALVVILGAMALVVAANVFCRFVLNASLYWGDELALVLMVWLTFLGAAVAVREKAHYVFDFALRRMSGRSRRAAVLVRDLVNVAAPLVLGVYSGWVTIRVQEWVMPAMEISRSVVYAACPIGCLLMVWYSLRHLAADWAEPA